jgi:O-antigen ligase
MLLVGGVGAAVALLLGEARLLNQASVDSRLLLWQAAAELWRSAPITGVGPGGFLWSYPAFLTAGAAVESNLLHPHNVWLELATGWGVPGLIWLVALLILWLRAAGRSLPAFSRATQAVVIGLSAALVGALAHAQVDTFLALPDLAAWLMMALGLMGMVTRDISAQ